MSPEVMCSVPTRTAWKAPVIRPTASQTAARMSERSQASNFPSGAHSYYGAGAGSETGRSCRKNPSSWLCACAVLTNLGAHSGGSVRRSFVPFQSLQLMLDFEWLKTKGCSFAPPNNARTMHQCSSTVFIFLTKRNPPSAETGGSPSLLGLVSFGPRCRTAPIAHCRFQHRMRGWSQ
jgi:hypothetical protein